jgi:Flp pilus assembly protein TadG
MTRRAPARRRERGQSLVETALVFPLLLFLFMGTVDAGRLLFAYIALEEAVQEGATYAAQVTNEAKALRDPKIIARVTTSSNHAEVIGATVAPPACTNATITVSATYPLPLLTPFGALIFGGTFTLGATVVATNLQGGCTA